MAGARLPSPGLDPADHVEPLRIRHSREQLEVLPEAEIGDRRARRERHVVELDHEPAPERRATCPASTASPSDRSISACAEAASVRPSSRRSGGRTYRSPETPRLRRPSGPVTTSRSPGTAPARPGTRSLRPSGGHRNDDRRRGGRVATDHGDPGLGDPLVEGEHVREHRVRREGERDEQPERRRAGSGEVAQVDRGRPPAEVGARTAGRGESALPRRVRPGSARARRPAPRRARRRRSGRAARARPGGRAHRAAESLVNSLPDSRIGGGADRRHAGCARRDAIAGVRRVDPADRDDRHGDGTADRAQPVQADRRIARRASTASPTPAPRRGSRASAASACSTVATDRPRSNDAARACSAPRSPWPRCTPSAASATAASTSSLTTKVAPSDASPRPRLTSSAVVAPFTRS